MNNNDQQWLNEIWHVEIHEEPRHLWPGQWTISGHWEDEKQLYNKYEKIWQDKRQEAWDQKYPNRIIDLNITDEDYFDWNVQKPNWSMHRDGSWNKMLVNTDDSKPQTRDQYPGIYNSYQHAITTLAQYSQHAPRFKINEQTDYEQYLKNFTDNYNYQPAK